MASPARHTSDTLAFYQALQETPEAYEFFEALRRLDCLHPLRPRLGRAVRPSDESVRLGHTPGLGFAPRGIDRFEPPTADAPARLYGLFLGVFGPNAPLPLHLTEYAIVRRDQHRDSTLSAFVDVFHHRMLSLFYRAWADALPTVELDRPGEDRFRHFVGALIGMATPQLQNRDALPDQYKRYFAGRLLSQARNAEGLKHLLEHYFGVSVHIQEFVAEWMLLPTDAHLRMGMAMAALGQDAVMGAQVRAAQQCFRLRIGPLNQAQFQAFMPGSETLKKLTAAVKTYLGEEKSWQLQLVLKKEEVPIAHLGQAGRMGLSTWMGHYRKPRDSDDVVIRPAA